MASEPIDYIEAHGKSSLGRKTHVDNIVQYLKLRDYKDFLPGRLQEGGLSHEPYVSCEVSHNVKGRGLEIVYGWHSSSAGELLIAQTGKGVCRIGFRVNNLRKEAEFRMRNKWPEAVYKEDVKETMQAAEKIVEIWRYCCLSFPFSGENPLKLHLQGTDFQIKVWKALLQIPCGRFQTYGDIAKAIGKPQAVRAVGNAVGANPLPLIIPCHRVIRSSGIVDNYGWGNARKKILLALEQGLL